MSLNDLTTGSLTRHLLKTASFMLVTMVFQTLYFLVDLYWVGRLGKEAVAAVSVAGNLMFVVLALSQMLGVGTTTLVSHASGRKDQPHARHVFTQSQVLSMLAGVAFLLVSWALRDAYANRLAADAVTASMARGYLGWFLPAMALQFALVGMGSALRGIGHFKPGMVVQTTTVIINLVLAPILMFGWLGAPAMGVEGPAIASLVAVGIGVAWLATYFIPADAYLRFDTHDWRPDVATWKRLVSIGLPAGAEFALMAVYLILVHSVTREFGAAAQAGFGIGQRVMQALFMPVVALGMSVAPVAGQNFGAGLGHRVRQTFRDGALMATAFMLAAIVVCEVGSVPLMRIFSPDPAVIAVGQEFLRISAWGFIASGVIFVASSTFQALGNTLPALGTSALRLVLVGVPIIWLSQAQGFHLRTIWVVSVLGSFVQLGASLWLLRREFAKKLPSGGPAATREPAHDVSA